MRVMVVGGELLEGFCGHIRDALVQMGHQAFIADYLPRTDPARVASKADWILREGFEIVRRRGGTMARRLVSHLFERAEGADLVICAHDFLWPEEVRAIKAPHRKVVLWFPDAVLNIGRAHFLAGEYDALFFKEPFLAARFRDVLELPAHYLPECFSPTKHCHVELEEADRAAYGCDVAMMGGGYRFRMGLAQRLSSYDLKIWGAAPPRWIDYAVLQRAHQRRFVAYTEKSKALLAAKIVVNSLHPSEFWGTNVKVFENAGIGAFQITEWRPSIATLFELGTEIETFRTLSELNQKLQRYLALPVERRRIADAGRARAHRDHTYQHRLKVLLDVACAGAEGLPIPRFDEPGAGF